MATRSTALLTAIVALFAFAGGLNTIANPPENDSRKTTFESDSGSGTVASRPVGTRSPMICITELSGGSVPIFIATRVDRGGSDKLRPAFVTSDASFLFSVCELAKCAVDTIRFGLSNLSDFGVSHSGLFGSSRARPDPPGRFQQSAVNTRSECNAPEELAL